MALTVYGGIEEHFDEVECEVYYGDEHTWYQEGCARAGESVAAQVLRDVAQDFINTFHDEEISGYAAALSIQAFADERGIDLGDTNDGA